MKKETIEISFERVEVKEGPRKLKGTWTFEQGEDVWLWSYEPWYKRLYKYIKGMVA